MDFFFGRAIQHHDNVTVLSTHKKPQQADHWQAMYTHLQGCMYVKIHTEVNIPFAELCIDILPNRYQDISASILYIFVQIVSTK